MTAKRITTAQIEMHRVCNCARMDVFVCFTHVISMAFVIDVGVLGTGARLLRNY